MIMKIIGPLMSVFLFLSVTTPASAQTSATKLTNTFNCSAETNDFAPVALTTVGYNGPVIITIAPSLSDDAMTEKNCTGSLASQNVNISCEKLLFGTFDDAASGTEVTVTGFPCAVSQDGCPQTGDDLVTTVSQMKLENFGGGNGRVTLQCNGNR